MNLAELAALHALIASTVGWEAFRALVDALRLERDRAAPSGYEMRPTISAWFEATREAYGHAYEALYTEREAAGLPRFETNCGACEECLAARGAV